jgi:hypothetical protein
MFFNLVSDTAVTALLNITDEIHGYFNRGLFVVLVLLDFSKTFDSVDHELSAKNVSLISLRRPLVSLIHF